MPLFKKNLYCCLELLLYSRALTTPCSVYLSGKLLSENSYYIKLLDDFLDGLFSEKILVNKLRVLVKDDELLTIFLKVITKLKAIPNLEKLNESKRRLVILNRLAKLRKKRRNSIFHNRLIRRKILSRKLASRLGWKRHKAKMKQAIRLRRINSGYQKSS